jgi:hypothetical protein
MAPDLEAGVSLAGLNRERRWMQLKTMPLRPEPPSCPMHPLRHPPPLPRLRPGRPQPPHHRPRRRPNLRWPLQPTMKQVRMAPLQRVSMPHSRRS